MNSDPKSSLMPSRGEVAPNSKWFPKQDVLEVALAGLQDLIPDDDAAFSVGDDRAGVPHPAESGAPNEASSQSRIRRGTVDRAALRLLTLAGIACVGLGSVYACSTLAEPYGGAPGLATLLAGALAILSLSVVAFLTRAPR